MDADDISLPHRVQTQVDFMESNPHLDLSGASVETFGGEKEQNIIYSSDPDVLKYQLFLKCPFAHPTVIFRVKFLK